MSGVAATDWRGFTDGLLELRGSEGTDAHPSVAFAFLNRFVRVDSCAVFKIAEDRSSGARHVCTFGELDDDMTEFLAEHYVASGFLSDPVVQTALPNVEKVRRLPNTHYATAYRNRFFERAGLIDKVTSLHAISGALFAVNFYRLSATGAFSDADLEDLRRLGPVIGRSVLRHDALTLDPLDTTAWDGGASAERLRRRIDALLADPTQAFGVLSPREAEVCRKLLLGWREARIAEALGVTPSTVVTYRKRIYAKLDVDSRTQLFQRALLAV